MNRHGWRSPLLGEVATLEVADGRIGYFARGRGPTLVFAHGWLVNANLWRNVVDGLHDDFRCVTLDLPLGSHRMTMPPGADLGPDGIAAVIASVLERLRLTDVTLVGNDSGGAYAQIAVARHTDRVGRLVLTSCETPYDSWPPAQFEHLRIAARDPELLRQAAEALRDPGVRRSAYGAEAGITKHPVADDVLDSYALPVSVEPDVRRDVAGVMSSASTAAIRSAGRRLIDGPPVPILLAWPREDMLFPVAHAERYARALPAGTLALIDDSYSFTPEDQPVRVAEEIRRFARAA